MKRKTALQFEKSEDIIDICLDPVFKAVFTKDTPDSRGGALGGIFPVSYEQREAGDNKRDS